MNIKYIAGIDISYSLTDKTKAIVVIVVYDYNDFLINPEYKKSRKAVYTSSLKVLIDIEYSPENFVSRELPPCELILNKLKNDNPLFYPDVLFIDGHGSMIGDNNLALAVGLKFDIPTVGVAKNMIETKGLTLDTIEEQLKEACKIKDDFMEIKNLDGKVLGIAYKRSNSTKNDYQNIRTGGYIYISIGHKIKLDQAFEIIKNTCFYRTVEPIRIADRIGRDKLKEIYNKEYTTIVSTVMPIIEENEDEVLYTNKISHKYYIERKKKKVLINAILSKKVNC